MCSKPKAPKLPPPPPPTPPPVPFSPGGSSNSTESISRRGRASLRTDVAAVAPSSSNSGLIVEGVDNTPLAPKSPLDKFKESLNKQKTGLAKEAKQAFDPAAFALAGGNIKLANALSGLGTKQKGKAPTKQSIPKPPNNTSSPAKSPIANNNTALAAALAKLSAKR